MHRTIYICIIFLVSKTLVCQNARMTLKDPDLNPIQFMLLVKNDTSVLTRFLSDMDGNLNIEKANWLQYKEYRFEVVFPTQLYNLIYENIICDKLCMVQYSSKPYKDACNCHYYYINDLLDFSNQKIFYVPRTKVAWQIDPKIINPWKIN